MTLNGSVYNSADLSINVFANTAYLDQVVTDLGGAPPLKTGGSYPRYRNFLIEGQAPGAFLGAILDPNMALPLYLPGDGVERCLEPSRAAALEYFSQPRDLSHFDVIPVGCAGGAAEYLMQYIGKPDPDFAGSFGVDMDFLGDFSLTTNFEYKFGNFHTQDLTGAFRQANAVIGRNVPGNRPGGVGPAEPGVDRRAAPRSGARVGEGVSGAGADVGDEPDLDIRLHPLARDLAFVPVARGHDRAVGAAQRNRHDRRPQREAVHVRRLPGHRSRDQPVRQLHRRGRELQLPHRDRGLRGTGPEEVHVLVPGRLLERGELGKMKRISQSVLPAAGFALLLSGCGLLDVDNPNALVEEDIRKAQAADAAVNGSQALVASGIARIYAPYSAIGDEIDWIGSRDAWNELNQGTPDNPGNEFADGAFPGIAQARWMSKFAVDLIAEHESSDEMQARMARANLYAGVAYSAIAQMFDDFAFSNRTGAGSPHRRGQHVLGLRPGHRLLHCRDVGR